MGVGPLLLVFVVIVAPLLLVLANKVRVRGKQYSFFMEGHRGLVPKMLKVQEDDFVSYGGGKYIVKEEAVRLTGYPSGWPSILQEMVPAALYKVGDGDPRDWNNLSERKISSRQLGSVLDPHWLGMIVKGWQKEAGGGTRFERMLPWLAIGVGAVTLLMVFVVMTKIGGIQQALSIITP